MNLQETGSWNRRRAKRLLMHYMKLAASGEFDWNHENASEVEDIVDCIINAAVKEAVYQIKAELAPKDNQQPEEDDGKWQIGDQQHEDNTLYYQEVGEGIKRFQR